MYNAERKMQFLAEREESAVIAGNLINAFESAEEMEKRYGKDLCEWTSVEIINFYKYLSTSSVQSLVQLHNSLTNYTTWCILNGLVKNNQNHFAEIKTQMLINCADVNNLVNCVVTRDQLLRDIKPIPNECDKFIILGLFEGILVSDDVMRNVKLSDLDGNILHLSNGIDLEISPELRHIMGRAAEEMYYERYEAKRKKPILYKHEDTIIRETVNNTSSNTTSTILIGGRYRRAIRYIGYSDGTTMKVMRESGRLHYMRKIATEYNVTMEETVTNHVIRVKHERIFGKIQNQTTYLSTYGKCF